MRPPPLRLRNAHALSPYDRAELEIWLAVRAQFSRASVLALPLVVSGVADAVLPAGLTDLGPSSTSLRIAMIWLSLNLDFFM